MQLLKHLANCSSQLFPLEIIKILIIYNYFTENITLPRVPKTNFAYKTSRAQREVLYAKLIV